IIDEYHYCQPMGKSPKETIVATRYVREESFEGAAGEGLLADVSGGDDRLLRRLPHGLAVVILVDDRLTDDEHALPLERRQAGDDLVGGVTGLEVVEEPSRLLGVDAVELIEQLGRAEHDVRGELDAAAEPADRLLLRGDAPRDVALAVRVVAAFAVDVRTQELDRLHRRRPLVDRADVDALQRRDRFGAAPVVEDRTAGALVHEPVGRDGHHEDVPVAARRLEVADVAGVQEIEHTVALDDGLVPLAERSEDIGQLVERPDLAPERAPVRRLSLFQGGRTTRVSLRGSVRESRPGRPPSRRGGRPFVRRLPRSAPSVTTPRCDGSS